MRELRNANGFPWLQAYRQGAVVFSINEGGRGLTFTVYREPCGWRLYLAGRVWCSLPAATKPASG